MVHVTSPLPIALEQLKARYPAGALTSLMMRVAITVARWEANRKFQRDIQHMPDYLLDDMGIERPFELPALKHNHLDYY